MISRRKLLKSAAGGLLLAGGVSALTACRGVKRDDLPGLDPGSVSIKGLSRDEVEILYLASLAPSSHNAQPWTVKVLEPGHWLVGSARQRWLPAVDPDNREMLLSLGAFIENLVIAAGALGLEVDLLITAASPMEPAIADLRLKKGKATGFPIEKIKKRRTVRNGFRGVDLKREDVRYVAQHDGEACLIANAPTPHAHYFSNNSREGRYLQEGLIEANTIQASRMSAQEELARWIRWSNKEARQYRNGLTPESMEIGGIAGWYVRNFYNRSSVLTEGFRKQTVDGVAKQVRTCGGWLVVTSLGSEVPTLIAYGRAFERLFLKVRERGIALHPMTQMLEERDRLKEEIGRGLGVTGEVQWVLRMGYLETYPDPVSLRMPPERFVLP